MPDPAPDSPANPSPAPPRPSKRRLPILARHAISLGVVFVLALPMSYLGVRYYKSEQQFKQLLAEDAETFEKGLAHIYANAADDDALTRRSVKRIDELPSDRAMELHRVLLRAYLDAGVDVPAELIVSGVHLIETLPMPDAVLVYRRLAAAGHGDDEKIRAALDRQLTVEDPRRFLQLVEFYDSEGMWGRGEVPGTAWLRWLTMLSHSEAEITQQSTARRLGEMPELVNDPQIAEALLRLSTSEFARVRAQVLKSAAGYAAIADDPTDYEQIIFTLGQDENQTIARRAWQVVGHLDPLSGFSPNWQDAPPYVAEGILWAAVKTNPDQVGPAIEAWDSGNELLAALAMYEATPSEDTPPAAIKQRFQAALTDIDTSEQGLRKTWLSLPYLDDDSYALVTDLQQKASRMIISSFEQRNADFDRGMLAAMCRYCRVGYIPDESADYPTIFELAHSESTLMLPTEAHDWPLAYVSKTNAWIGASDAAFEIQHDEEVKSLYDRFFEQSELENLLAHAASDRSWPFREPILEAVSDGGHNWWLIWIAANTALFDSQSLQESGFDRHIEKLMREHGGDTMQYASLLAAIYGLDPTFIRGVTAKFLRQNPDITDDQLHAMTDAELAEFGLRRVDAIKALIEVAKTNPDPAERFETVSLLKLALWMRGDLGDEFTAEAEAMLLDPRLPTSTVLLALLHKQRPIALEYLFGDLVEPNPDLSELFIGERFWHVFRRFVKTDDLDLWLWGDPAAQDFQLEAMRQWYWVNRWRLDGVWVGAGDAE